MRFHRWVRHRFNDGNGNDHEGKCPVNLFSIAAAAAEETLQGSPMAAAWLDLFRSHLSRDDRHWLRWQGDLAESAELRRAYSGLYGRFFARAVLRTHLGITHFLSLGRNGVSVSNSVTVERTASGDIPDWIAWSPATRRHVLAEAKGSLTANDFLNVTMPSCIAEGKKQFERVMVRDGSREIKPERWVAAARWATDVRQCDPVTALWDPPILDEPYTPEDGRRHEAAMHRAWLNSVAPGFGLTSPDAFGKLEGRQRGLTIAALPGGMDEDALMDIRIARPQSDIQVTSTGSDKERDETQPGVASTDESSVQSRPLEDCAIYRDSVLLTPHKGEASPYLGHYVAAAVSRFGIQQIRDQEDVDLLRRHQERIHKAQESPMMIVGVPIPHTEWPLGGPNWNDAAGLAQKSGISVFDLSRVELVMDPEF